jgi:hypothetical protein
MDIFVRRHQDVEASLFRGVDQFAVCEFLATPRPRLLHGVAGEETGKTSRPLSKSTSIQAIA